MPMAPGPKKNTASGFSARILETSAWKSLSPSMNKVWLTTLPLYSLRKPAIPSFPA